ncbi:hypothetical protein [Lactiplantibacillus plantarum]|uniref:hypothetical protein n=1 Tax=Lactiplantibacillus plantarum TaxID=1590 RepID=UPI000E5A053B|nr:hypothetical protein [Lactiplantibacillus plantarum]MCB7465799.1 hypothetical protein [Lactiplantibacillus plantarum]MCB7469789.1 hypothetical protein [Lactiplantibacillus plantarum]MCB7471919.1 hypothetical protein [Lactiplantibacillus plantarum]MCB7475484.1 hypothetical protein [Lactiplantibacillus plantarum]MCB7478372.1 hypothetical protein [Lactiplantibacillus plantarum]
MGKPKELPEEDKQLAKQAEKALNNENDTKKSTATELKNLVFEQPIEFGYNEEFRAFARVSIKDHHEVYALDSLQFHDYLFQLYDEKTQNVLPKLTYDSVNEYLATYSRVHGQQQNVVMRVGINQGKYYLDLCNDQWQVVEVTKDGWQITKDSPVWFYRTNDMAALPIPDHHGGNQNLLELGSYLNFKSDNSLDLITGWLMGSFLVNSSRPILVIQGIAGAGKTTASRLIRGVVDPAKQKHSISRPKLTVDSLAIDAIHQHTLVYDNFSAGTITAEISDMLCTMATNQSYSKRALYTDSDEVLVKLGRSIIINGIDDLAKRQDLLDRSIILEIEAPKKRRTEEEIYRWFTENHSLILGALLNAVVDSLKYAGQSNFTGGRMVDWCRFVENAHRELGATPRYFGDIYVKNRHQAAIDSADTNPFVSGILELLDGKKQWRGKKSELVSELKKLDSYDPYENHGAIPKTNKVAERLRRDQPILKQVGIEYEETKSKGNMYVTFKHRTGGNSMSTLSTPANQNIDTAVS